MPARRPVLLFALTCLSLLPAAYGAPGGEIRADGPENLTLEEAFRLVETANFTAMLSREAVTQAIEAAHQQRAGLLPQVTWDVTQRRSRTASVGGALVRSGINNRFDSALNGRLDLLDPARIAAYQVARQGVEVARLDAAQVMQTVLAAVGQAYFTHLRNLRRFEVIESNIERARVLLELSRNQLNAGVATQIDVTRAEAQLAATEQDRLQQVTAVRASELQLKQLLAFDLSRPLQLEEFSVRRGEATETTAQLETAAFEHRLDLREAEELLRQNGMAVRAARYDRLPAISLIGSFGKATENVLDGGDTTVWSGTVAFSLPVFDGRRLQSIYNQARSRQHAQEVQVSALRLQIGSEVRLAAQDAASRFAQIAVVEKSRTLAEDELRLARIRFEQGVADNREIVDAQNSLAVASDNLVEAVYQYNLSRLELARVRGEVRAILRERAG